MFWKKKSEPLPLTSGEYEKLSKLFTSLDSEIILLKNRVDSQDLAIKKLRANLNRHIYEEETEEEEQKGEGEDIKEEIGLPKSIKTSKPVFL